MNTIPFQYHPDILDRFPNLSGVAMLGENIKNLPSPDELGLLYRQEQAAVKDRIGNQPLSDLPTLAGWRAAFRQFGVDPTQYRSAAEALLRRLTKKGDIPGINVIVDCCNLISIRYALPVAAIDLKQVTGMVTVCLADGSEHFNPLGEDAPGPPEPGEVIFMDDAGLVLARRWCWRQSVESAAGMDATHLLITMESQDPMGANIIETALGELKQLLERFTGGTFAVRRIV